MSEFNEYVWIPHAELAWELARVVGRDVGEGNVHVQSLTDEAAGVQIIPVTSAFHFDQSHSQLLDDLCDMNNLHEAPLLNTLAQRLNNNKMYTSASNILLSVNPYRNIEGLFDHPIDFYEPNISKETLKLSMPHVFKLANTVLHCLVNGGGSETSTNQSVVISGESGAGKTEASKYVMRFLIAVDESKHHSQGSSGRDIGSRIRDLLVDTNIVLEAFGNAKTVRNDNSSRFGKYTMLQYSGTNVLTSAFTQTFLLEKSRLTSVGQNERNYHVLYQLVKGTDSSLSKSVLRLHDVHDFRILTSGDCTVAGNIDQDAENFSELCSALRTLGCSAVEISSVWSLLACILHMGNITVAKASGEGVEETVLLSPTMPLESIAELLGSSPDDFRNSLIYHMVKVEKRSSVSRKMLSSEETMNNIWGLMKWIYHGVFRWLVRKLNAAYNIDIPGTGPPLSAVIKFVGILDIFGFETLLNNSFEQLCINFANERLQQQFNEQVFVFEQSEYEKEGLNWSNVTFRDNQQVIDLISKKPSGLLIVLEEHGMLNRKPDDGALLQSYAQVHYQKHASFSKPRFGSDAFIVKHFAGDVTYNVVGFLGKNNDSLQDDLLELIKATDNKFLLNAMEISADSLHPGYVAASNSHISVETTAALPRSSSAVGGKKMASTVTVSFQFRSQLDDLVATLRATKPHYIKCLKPNTTKSAVDFNPSLVLEQLRYSGILEVVRIRREGYPTRMPFREFYEKFCLLGVLSGYPRWTACSSTASDEDIRRYATGIAEIVFLSGTSDAGRFQSGHSKIFLMDGALDKIKRALNDFRRTYCLKIQSWLRSKFASYRYRVSKVGAIKFQKNIRRFICQKNFQKKKSAHLKIGKFCVKEYLRRQAAKKVSVMRAEEAERRRQAVHAAEVLRLAEAAKYRAAMELKVNNWVGARCRRKVQQRFFLKYKGAVVKVQCGYRIHIAKQVYLQRKREKFAVAVNALMKFGRIIRRKILQTSLSSLLDAIRKDDGLAVIHIMTNNKLDENIVLRVDSTEYRSLLHLACYLGKSVVLAALKPTRQSLLKLDRKGRNVFHHWAMGHIPSIPLVMELIECTKGTVGNARTSLPDALSVVALTLGNNDASSVVKEGWLRKKRPGNKFERRWTILEKIDGGVKLSYYKSKGDKSSKGEVVLMKAEEASTVKRVPLSETSGAPDELFQFEIYSPAGLYHKSKPPVMLFCAENEIELQEWLAPVRFFSGRTGEDDNNIELGARDTSVTRFSAATDRDTRIVRGGFTNIKYRESVFSEPDNKGDTPIHLICRRFIPSIHNLNSDALATHQHNQVSHCLAVLWLLENSFDIRKTLLQATNELNQTPLHLSAIAQNFLLAEALVYFAVRWLKLNNVAETSLKLIHGFLEMKDVTGKSAKDYFKLHHPDREIAWLDVSAVSAHLKASASTLLSVSNIHFFPGYTYLNLLFSSVIAPCAESVPSENSVFRLPLKISLRALSGDGHWLTKLSIHDVCDSILAVKSVSESIATICIGYNWTLTIPLQNVDDSCIVIFDVRNSDSNDILGWSYFRLSNDPFKLLQFQGLKEIYLIEGDPPVSMSYNSPSPGARLNMPQLPTLFTGSMQSSLKLEYNLIHN